MPLNVGTLVRPYTTGDSDASDGIAGFTCKSDVCVGIIRQFDVSVPDWTNVLAEVEWYHECEGHKRELTRIKDKRTIWYGIDQLWEIGQTN